MNNNNPVLLTASSLTLTTKAVQINKTGANYIAKLSIYIMTVVLLLMAGNVSSDDMDDMDDMMVGNVVSSVVMGEIMADMGLNEASLLNTTKTAGWAKGAVIDMGSAPRGDATQSYWKPSNLAYKSSDPWKTVIPWFVIYPGKNHAATNVRVKFYGLRLYFLTKSTNTWKKIDTGSGLGWAKNMDFALNSTAVLDAPVARQESDGNFSYKLTPEFYPIHGGYSRYALIDYGINPSDIAAVFIRFKTKLILDDPLGKDDRASAEILAQVGADYYPAMSTQISDYSPMKYAPAIGSSRFGIVQKWVRTHYFATIDPPGSNNDSKYVLNGGEIVIPVGQFEANMPPHLFDTIPPSAPTPLSLTVTKQKSSALNELSWKASSDNLTVAGYKIYRNGKVIGVSTSTYFKDTFNNAATGSLYEYTVKAFDDADNLSASSNKVQTVY
jgi:hypothetical protein